MDPPSNLHPHLADQAEEALLLLFVEEGFVQPHLSCWGCSPAPCGNGAWDFGKGQRWRKHHVLVTWCCWFVVILGCFGVVWIIAFSTSDLRVHCLSLWCCAVMNDFPVSERWIQSNVDASPCLKDWVTSSTVPKNDRLIILAPQKRLAPEALHFWVPWVREFVEVILSSCILHMAPCLQVLYLTLCWLVNPSGYYLDPS